jgi:hypothetical protein
MAQGTERECVSCGATFTGRYRKCPGCRPYRTERTCECGKIFRGETLKCTACQKTERRCVDCGEPISSRYQRCRHCREKPNPCAFPGCAEPKTRAQGARYCQQHRDETYQRKLERIRRATCYMPGCDEPKVALFTSTGRRRPYRYCAKHSAEAPQREREQIIRRSRERRFGITHGQFLAMLESQGGVCAICGNGNDNGRQLSIDHNHATGAVRGLLCDRCNPMLGYARDRTDVLQAAISYLRQYGA